MIVRNYPEPQSFYRSDTVTWTRVLQEYPSPDWTLTYLFSRATDTQVIVAAADGSGGHVVTLSQAETAAFAAGQYRWQAYVEQGAERRTVAASSIQVINSLDTAQDTRTHNETVLEALQAVMENKASQDQLKISIAGKTLDRFTLDDIIKATAYYEGKVRADQQAAANQQGGQKDGQMIGLF